jgi:hypothetical protein
VASLNQHRHKNYADVAPMSSHQNAHRLFPFTLKRLPEKS